MVLKKKVLIVLVVLVLIIISIFLYVKQNIIVKEDYDKNDFHLNNELDEKNDIKEVEVVNDENDEQEAEVEESNEENIISNSKNNEGYIQDSSGNDSYFSDSDNSSSKTSISTSKTDANIEVNNNDSNEVDKSDISYSIHKGRIDKCTYSNDCSSVARTMALKYPIIIGGYTIVDIYSISRNILGYFIEYKFLDASYSTNEECLFHGEEIRKDLSNIITNYSCSSRDGKYVLHITADYD